MNAELRQGLEHVARRLRRARLWAALAACWLAWALAGWGLGAWLSRPGNTPIPIVGLLAAFVALAAATGIACAALILRTARDRRAIARRIEAKYPELNAGLLAAVEEDAAAPPGPRGFLQATVIQGAIDHGRSHDWDAAVSPWKLRGATCAHLAALGLLLFVTSGLIGRAWSRDFARKPGAGIIDPSGIQVDPGDAEIERGAPLLVVARFGESVPNEAALVIEGAAGPDSAARQAMTRSLEDPTFAGRVASVDSDLGYRIEAGDRTTKTYRVKVFEYPDVVRTDAHLAFPSYTGLPPKTAEDIRHVTAIEGTDLALVFRLNKDVASARLVAEGIEPIPLVADGTPDHAYRASLALDESRRYRVELTDHDGRANKSPIEIAINVTRNRPATIKMTRPAHDVRVSPVEELALAAQLDDDFGVIRHGINYTLAGQEPQDLVLPGPDPAPKRIEAKHQLDFESLGVAPDQLVTYHFWAEDIGPDGQPRRSFGDMFFAEVRPFEEIFRQGQQPTAGESESQGQQQGGGNGQQAMQLAELQKQIINATWKLIRREVGVTPTDAFAGDAKLTQESQQSAIQQADQLGERLQDAASKASLAKAIGFMKDADRLLGDAAGPAGPKGLASALAAEQAAYQALLKLRDREFEIVRRNTRQQQGGSSSAGSPSQQQLRQLELSNEENRYEEQRSARSQQNARTQQEQEQGELRQVLNRLRELAQRQSDLNERLKELQSALEAAQDEQEREEIQRQLKRLRDQEQQILRDTDELQERMEREENRERMAEAREQVEQGREHTRQASEALERGQVSQALTEGTRASRQLEDLRDELRKESSNRFSEEMTAMRDEARRLDEAQDKLTDQLEAAEKSAQHSLRDEGRKDLRDQLGQQKEQLDGLLDRMKGTVQEAEETEPRLAKELFDAARKADEQSIGEALKAAEQLTDLGVTEEAARASRQAARGLDELREGVERAAESVLGDETAALRLARGELQDLSNILDREIGQSTSQEPTDRQAGQSSQAPRPRRDGDAAKDQRDEGRESREGERQPREGQARDGQGQEDREESRRQAGKQGQGQQGDRQSRQGQRGEGSNPTPEEGEQQGQQGEGRQDQQGEREGEQQGQQQGQGRQQGQGEQQGQGPQGGQGGQGRTGSGLDRLMDGMAEGGNGGPGGPIAGDGFRQWSDRMRNVEELLDDPDLRAEAARIRDRVRGAREEFKRHSKEPDWNQLQTLVAEPLRELSRRVAEEVTRRESPDSLVPIDRDPVPPQYAEGVRRYYERLGSGQ